MASSSVPSIPAVKHPLIYPDDALLSSDVNFTQRQYIFDHFAKVPVKPRICTETDVVVAVGAFCIGIAAISLINFDSPMGYVFYAVAASVMLVGIRLLGYRVLNHIQEMRSWTAANLTRERFINKCSSPAQDQMVSDFFCAMLMLLPPSKCATTFVNLTRLYSKLNVRQVLRSLNLIFNTVESSSLEIGALRLKFIRNHYQKFNENVRRVFDFVIRFEGVRAEPGCPYSASQLVRNPYLKDLFIQTPFLLEACVEQVIANGLYNQRQSLLEYVEELRAPTNTALEQNYVTINFALGVTKKVFRHCIPCLDEFAKIIDLEDFPILADVRFDVFESLINCRSNDALEISPEIANLAFEFKEKNILERFLFQVISKKQFSEVMSLKQGLFADFEHYSQDCADALQSWIFMEGGNTPFTDIYRKNRFEVVRFYFIRTGMPQVYKMIVKTRYQNRIEQLALHANERHVLGVMARKAGCDDIALVCGVTEG